MAISVKKRQKIIFNVPILKKDGWSRPITYNVSAGLGVNVSFTPTGTTGTANDTLKITAEITDFASTGANFVQITGSPPPKDPKKIDFTVLPADDYGWEYGLPVEYSGVPTTPPPATTTQSPTAAVEYAVYFRIHSKNVFQVDSVYYDLSVSDGRQIALSNDSVYKNAILNRFAPLSAGTGTSKYNQDSFDDIRVRATAGESVTFNYTVRSPNNANIRTYGTFTIKFQSKVVVNGTYYVPQVFVDVNQDYTTSVFVSNPIGNPSNIDPISGGSTTI